MITRRKFIAGSAAVAAGSAIAGPVGFRLPGGFTDPRSIGGLKLWLDASQIVGLNDGDAVGTWADLSGNGNDATQATGSKKPTFQTNEQNGRPVVQFDGTDDLLYSARLIFDVNVTVFCVVSFADNTTRMAVLDLKSSAPGGNDYFTIEQNNASGNYYGFYTSSTLFNTTFAASSGAKLFSVKANTTFGGGVVANTEYRVNATTYPLGVLSGAGTYINYTGLLGFTVGSFNDTTNNALVPLNGKVCEVVAYNQLLSASDIARVESYLNAKWAIY